MNCRIAQAGEIHRHIASGDGSRSRRLQEETTFLATGWGEIAERASGDECQH